MMFTHWKRLSKISRIRTYWKTMVPCTIVSSDCPTGIWAMEILGSLLETCKHNQFVIEIRDLSSIPTRAVPTFKMTASPVMSLFVDNCIFPPGTSTYRFMQNVKECTSTFSEVPCSNSPEMPSISTACHSETHAQAKIFKKSTMLALRHPVVERH